MVIIALQLIAKMLTAAKLLSPVFIFIFTICQLSSTICATRFLQHVWKLCFCHRPTVWNSLSDDLQDPAVSSDHFSRVKNI